MILVDANLLLHAYDETAPQHEPARRWLASLLDGSVTVRFPLVSLLAFVRIGTNPVVFDQPLAPDEAIAIVRSWLERPGAAVAEPTAHHWEVLATTMADGQVRGPQATDAHLAALTMEHGGTLHTADRGFARFPDLRFTNPLVEH